jgi:hypothetical protein
VVLVRDGNRTAINMLNDYRGPLKEFAMVVPVPVVLQKDDVKTPFRALFERIDAYSAPRLAEYYDHDPCVPLPPRADDDGATRACGEDAERHCQRRRAWRQGRSAIHRGPVRHRDPLGVAIRGLETWLVQNGYRIPRGAAKVLGPYIKQNMKFFVARVNLKEHEKSGDHSCRRCSSRSRARSSCCRSASA